jgi:ABC transporter substrate binding protein
MAVPVVGLLSASSLESLQEPIVAFREALTTFGYVEGRNVAIEYRVADDHYDRMPQLAADLVRREVKVIVSMGGSPTLLAAKAATTTIPIVFVFGGDPVGRGIVASLNRPGGNLTGITALSDEMGPKRLELLREVVTSTHDFGFLVKECGDSITSHGGCGSNSWHSAPGLAREHRLRIGGGIFRTGWVARGRIGNRRRPVFQQPVGAIWRTVAALFHSRNLSVSGVRRGGGPYELRYRPGGVGPPNWHLHRPDSPG